MILSLFLKEVPKEEITDEPQNEFGQQNGLNEFKEKVASISSDSGSESVLPHVECPSKDSNIVLNSTKEEAVESKVTKESG